MLQVKEDLVSIRDDRTGRIRLQVALPPHDPTEPLIVTAFDGDWGVSPEQALAFCGAVCGLAIKAKERASRILASCEPQVTGDEP